MSWPAGRLPLRATVLPEIEIVTSLVGLEALRPEWQLLWQRVPQATPFQSPAWLIPWWRVFGAGDELLTVVLRSNGSLIGLVPLYIHTGEDGRKLLPVGIGISDYLDPLLEPQHAEACAASALDILSQHAHRFDRCDLECQREDSALLRVVPPPGWQSQTHAGEPCPVLDLTAPAELHHGPLSGHRLNRLRYYRRRAEAMGPVAFEPGTIDNLDELLTTLFDLHGRRWQERSEPGVLADPRVQAFHRVSAPLLLADGRLRLWSLRVAGRIVAVFHGMADRSRFHIYIGGFDPDLRHLSPGTLVIGHMIQEAMREGRCEAHFLRGRESYKYTWGAVDRPSWGRRLQPLGPDRLRQ